jgi:hypothetical protein
LVWGMPSLLGPEEVRFFVSEPLEELQFRVIPTRFKPPRDLWMQPCRVFLPEKPERLRR